MARYRKIDREADVRRLVWLSALLLVLTGILFVKVFLCSEEDTTA